MILLSEMGSLILAYPMFKRIKERYPEAEISVLLFRRNKQVIDLLELIQESDVFTISDESPFRFAADVLKALIKMRRRGIDTVVDCELFSRISSILALLSGARIRVGFYRYTQEGLYRGTHMTGRVTYNPYRHISEQFLTLVEAINPIGAPPAKQTDGREMSQLPKPAIAANEIAILSKRLQTEFGNIFDRPLILIHPGGGVLPIRAWPVNHYEKLCERFSEDGYGVGIIGLDLDKALAKRIIRRCNAGGSYDLTGYTKTVRELLVLFELACLLITNDGGPGHIASLSSIPTIIFYGPETPTLYGPRNIRALALYREIPCSPCLTAYNHRNSFCDGDNVCLKAIGVDEVYCKAVDLLESVENCPSQPCAGSKIFAFASF